MLLIITHTEDYTVDYLANILNKRGLHFLRLNTDNLPEYNYKIITGKSIKIEVNGKSEFQSIWFRRVKLPEFSQNPEIDGFIALDYDALLFGIITSLDTQRVLSEPYNVYRAENKLFQIRNAIEIGFNVPNSLLTSSKSALIEFVRRQSSVIKPIRSGRFSNQKETFLIYTNRILEEQIKEEHTLTPAIYQKEIKKLYEVRVTVVDDKVFAAKVFSQSDPETALDWRRKQLKFEPHILPCAISDKCRLLVKRMGLCFGAIDLIYSQSEEYYFLEINPNGQWVWIESDTGLPISEAMINYLYNV